MFYSVGQQSDDVLRQMSESPVFRLVQERCWEGTPVCHGDIWQGQCTHLMTPGLVLEESKNSHPFQVKTQIWQVSEEWIDTDLHQNKAVGSSFFIPGISPRLAFKLSSGPDIE